MASYSALRSAISTSSPLPLNVGKGRNPFGFRCELELNMNRSAVSTISDIVLSRGLALEIGHYRVVDIEGRFHIEATLLIRLYGNPAATMKLKTA
jgi:hypothetical protein